MMRKILVLTAIAVLVASAIGCQCCDRFRRGAMYPATAPPVVCNPCPPANPCDPCVPCDPCAPATYGTAPAYGAAPVYGTAPSTMLPGPVGP